MMIIDITGNLRPTMNAPVLLAMEQAPRRDPIRNRAPNGDRRWLHAQPSWICTVEQCGILPFNPG